MSQREEAIATIDVLKDALKRARPEWVADITEAIERISAHTRIEIPSVGVKLTEKERNDKNGKQKGDGKDREKYPGVSGVVPSKSGDSEIGRGTGRDTIAGKLVGSDVAGDANSTDENPGLAKDAGGRADQSALLDVAGRGGNAGIEEGVADDLIISCPACWGRTKLYGRTKRHAQRHACLECGKTFILAKDRRPYDHRIPPDHLEVARKLLLGGITIRWTARILRIAKCTARRIKRELEAEGNIILCPCGRISRHQGWCRFRYLQSPRRQMFMKRWRGPGRRKIAGDTQNAQIAAD